MSETPRDGEADETRQLDLSETFQKSAEVVDSHPSPTFVMPAMTTLDGPVEEEPSPSPPSED